MNPEVKDEPRPAQEVNEELRFISPYMYEKLAAGKWALKAWEDTKKKLVAPEPIRETSLDSFEKGPTTAKVW